MGELNVAGSYVIDVCSRCQLLWLDAGERQQLLRDSEPALDATQKAILAATLTLLAAAPKILEFWQGLSVVRDARKPLDLEKVRLENLKLRIEIEALKKGFP